MNENDMLVKLAKPYSFEGKEYTEIDLSGLKKMKVEDVVKVQNKLMDNGEQVAMVLPETSTAFAMELAARAAELPIEFMRLMPMGASRKVRSAVQKALSIKDEPQDGKKHTMVFNEGYLYKGKEYTEIDLSGIASMTSMDVCAAENRLIDEGIVIPEASVSYVYCCVIAARATNMPEEFFLGLPVCEALKLKRTVNSKDFFE